MKYLKMLGLVAVAVAALMAFVGASSASAGVLCTKKEDPCGAGARVAKTETVSMQLVSGFKASLNTGPKNSECNKSTISGEVIKEGGKGEVPEVSVEALTFTECTNCEVAVLKDGTYYVSHIVTTFDGRVFGTGQEITVQCNTIFGKLDCIYLTSNTLLGELSGGSPAILEVNAELPFKAGPELCKSPGIWTGKYEVTKPKPLYVASS